MGEAAYSEGEDAAELGGDLGMEPIEWQSLVLSDWCACDAEGRPAYVTCGLDVPRQNGKNAVIEIYEVFRLAVCGWHILHTAHRVKTAKKAFNRLVRYFTDKEHPELSCLVERIRRTNGEEAIYLTNGGSIEFSARTNGSARGFDDIQLVVFDEAQELTDSQYDAIMYTLAASATGERQIIYTGTPPNEDCPGTVFARTRAAILAGDIPSTEWCSWATDECPRQDATFDDVVDLIYESNPSMGIILSLDFTRTEFAGGSITGFAHERLGWFSPAAMLTRAIPRESWDAALIDAIGDRYRGKKAFGVKFSRDGSTYALSGCKLGQRALKGKAAVELIRVGTTAGGARELAEWLYDRRTTASVVVIDGMSGADALIDRLAEMRPPRGYVVRPQTRDVVAAAVGFVDALNDGTLAHTYDPTLEESARKCVRRKIGSRGGWGFGSPEDATVPPEPLESCSLALWGARNTKRNPRRKQRTL